MKIFADLHHQGLFASLHYLFEDRLKHELYRPIGMDWFANGYWKIAEPYNNNMATVSQYLSMDKSLQPPEDGTKPINKNLAIGIGHYTILETVHNYKQKALTFDQFANTQIDLVIASIPAHIKTYKRLIKQYQPKAKLIYQIGNVDWEKGVPWDEVDNVMASVKEFPVPDNKNVVFYRQEFDLSCFKKAMGHGQKIIISFVNLLPHKELWEQYKQRMSDYSFMAYGIGCPDGIKTNIWDIAATMRRATWGYHYKPEGDGFGHIIHNWMACGKPVLVNLDAYKDKLAGELLVDMETCLDISTRSIDNVAALLRGISPLQYADMCNNVTRQFRKVVDFENDAQKIEKFLENLL